MNEVGRVGPDQRRRMLDIAGQVAVASTPAEAARGLTVAMHDLLGCVRAYCFFYDATNGTLWSEPPDERELHPAAGLVGLAVHTRQPVPTDVARAHPAYRRSIDDPAGRGTEGLLVQPVVSMDGQVHAVLVGVRPAEGQHFTPDDIQRSALLAAYVAPMLEHLGRVADTSDDNEEPARESGREVAQARPGAGHGDVIRVIPPWLPTVSWIVLAFVVFIAGFLAFGRVDQYSTGIGAIRAGDRSSVVCREAGALDEILVAPGDEVEKGQVLARLDDADLQAELERLDFEYHAHLRNRMRNPDDRQAAQSVLGLRGQLEAVRARLREREIRAQHAGRVVDLRGRLGQSFRPGDVVLTMSKPDGQMELVALLPGDDRPQIDAGMRLRFQLPGYRHEYQWFEVTEVGDSVLGPAEAARLLGPEVGDVVAPTGPSVLVRARVPSKTFVARGEALEYHDGMFGEAEVRVRRESLLTVLFPWATGVLP